MPNHALSLHHIGPDGDRPIADKRMEITISKSCLRQINVSKLVKRKMHQKCIYAINHLSRMMNGKWKRKIYSTNVNELN